jgi:ferredoxin
MEIKVDAELCTGCEVCLDAAPDLLEMGDEGAVITKVTAVPADQEDAAAEAADSCPCEAIIIEE